MIDKFKKNTHCDYCQKEMDAKYRSKKFCSSKCRTYYNREFKKGDITDSVPQLHVAKLPIIEKPYFEEHKFELRRSFANWIEMKRDCDNNDDWAKIVNDIKLATNLTNAQKQQLLSS